MSKQLHPRSTTLAEAHQQLTEVQEEGLGGAEVTPEGRTFDTRDGFVWVTGHDQIRLKAVYTRCR